MKPAELKDSDSIFHVAHLMPKMSYIPKEFHMMGRTKWNQLFNDWFFRGLKSLKVEMKDGIDETKAMHHLSAVMHSWEPKHEHKEAACAYLMSLWFKDAKWEAQERKE